MIEALVPTTLQAIYSHPSHPLFTRAALRVPTCYDGSVIIPAMPEYLPNAVFYLPPLGRAPLYLFRYFVRRTHDMEAFQNMLILGRPMKQRRHILFNQVDIGWKFRRKKFH